MYTVVIKDNEWKGKVDNAFPVKATWESGYYSDVFKSVEALKNYMIGCYGKVRFLDHRKKV